MNIVEEFRNRARQCRHSYVDTLALENGTFVPGYWCGRTDILKAGQPRVCPRSGLYPQTGQAAECPYYEPFDIDRLGAA